MTFPVTARRIDPDLSEAVSALWLRDLPDEDGVSEWLPTVLADLLRRGLVFGRGLFADGPPPVCQAFGLSTFLREDAADGFVADPAPYLNLRLLGAARAGDVSAFLTLEEVAHRNAGEGLELFILEYTQTTFDFDDPLAHDLLSLIVPQYLANHAGYNIRRTMHETEISKGHIQEAGSNRRLFDVFPQHPFSLSDRGHGPRAVYGLTRAEAMALPATGIAKVPFAYTPPVFRFVPREQQILAMALEGMTDQAISAALGISRDGVRNHWRAIYDHVEDTAPPVFGDTGTPGETTSRGAEKRRRVLAHLKDRPEELRPYTLKRAR